MLQQPAEPRLADDVPRRHARHLGRRRPARRDVAQPLVWTHCVVVSVELAQQVAQVGLAEDQEVVQALLPDGLHAPLRRGVEVGAPDRQPLHLYAILPQDRVELLDGLGRSVTPGHYAPLWTPEKLALLGTMPDDQLARQLGRTQGGVRQKRQELGIPNHFDRRYRHRGGDGNGR
jgi:hypothetical protein